MKIEKNKKIRIIFQLILITLTIVTITYATINMVRDKKQGKSIQCGGDCRNCGRGCH